jgi:poly(A) polymerase/tRNA nucleotidyltransferase (CCA-adding enzyme)
VIDLVRLRAASLEADLCLRDFTINALALPLTQVGPLLAAADGDAQTRDIATLHTYFIDPCNGLQDIARRTLRLCSPTSLQDDPLRSMRALRQAAELDLHFSPELDTALREAAPLITQVAAERVRDELLKLLATPYAARWLRAMDAIGLLTRVFPELEPARDCEQPIVHFLPVLGHSLETVAAAEWLLQGLHGVPPAASLPAAVQAHPQLERDLPFAEQFRQHMREQMGGSTREALFKLAALLHDNAKPQTRQPKPDGGVSFHGHQAEGAEVAAQIAKRLRLSRQAAAYIARIVKEHMRPGQLRNDGQVTPRAMARFFRDTGDAGPAVLLHSLADHMAARGPFIDPADWQQHRAWVGQQLERYWGAPPERTRPLVNGHTLMQALDIAPGRLVGELLQEIQEAQAAGEISTPAEALHLARRQLEAGER